MSSTVDNIPALKKVLIVDDNKIYRDAFRRNLMLRNCQVTEAEDSDDALRQIAQDMPDVVITDLQMRSETEGLDLIREIKASYPILPIIMISAVGTFEEGACAQRLGAHTVISKSRIEEEIEHLYRAIEQAYQDLQRDRVHEAIIEQTRTAITGDVVPDASLVEQLRNILSSPNVHPYLRQEAFNLFSELNERVMKEEAQRAASTAGIGGGTAIEDIERVLAEAMPAYPNFDADTRDSLRIAEFLFSQQNANPALLDFSRNVGFSYCFAVENEAKTRLTKRIQKLLNSDATYSLITEMLEANRQSVSVFYQQYILRLLRGHEWDITIDNLCQTFRRMLEHQARYKPDGLKALGIIVLVFGREYAWTKKNRTIQIANPLQLRGFEREGDLMRFAELLVQLQHHRNPYIHPEISELEKISVIRKNAFECLNLAGKIS